MVRRALALIGTVVLISVTIGSAASGQGATKLSLIGPRAVISCRSLDPLGENARQAGPGFVTFKERSGTLRTQVVLRGAEPQTRYVVRVIQRVGDCFHVDGVTVTNDRGNGVLHLSEPLVREHAQVIIDTGRRYKSPTYRATRIFLVD
jgi:hypothetical protein